MSQSGPPQPERLRDDAVRWLDRMAYLDALALQERLVSERQRGETGDQVLLLEHEPVYTIGRTRDQSSLGESGTLPYPAIETNRGGQATYHGPGQLVGYPIINLKNHVRDLHWYLRALEDVLIQYLHSLKIAADVREGMTGVWVGTRKIASIGVGVRKWVTMHGFALNVHEDLSGFEAITPCGIEGVAMTSVNRESRVSYSVGATADAVRPYLVAAFG